MNIDLKTELLSLTDLVLAWWAEHESDTYGEYGENNVYWCDPDFVAKAKAIKQALEAK